MTNCMCFTRKFRISEVTPPLDVKELFNDYSVGGTHMTVEQLHRFLLEVQSEDRLLSEVKQTVEEVLQRRHSKFIWHHNNNNSNSSSSGFSLDDFFHYLFSTDHNSPINDKVHQDMDAPLSHYYIYTGHNSYLTGNQLSSECSDIPIVKALKRGVRAVELDLWPNSTKDNILVLHGWTLTSPVELIKCLRSIKEYAFFTSPYPVIITLEDHLTPDLQDKVAEMISETFGDIVFNQEPDSLKEFPSPEELKYRIILSTKPPKDYTCESKTFKTDRKIHSPKKTYYGPDGSDSTNYQETNEKSDMNTSEQSQGSEDSYEQDFRSSEYKTYKSLIAIPSGHAKNGIKNALQIEPDKVKRLSLIEQKFKKATDLYGADVLRFTQKNLLRIYPKGIRVDSSNYKPLKGWIHGAQMIAFNMQGYGKSLWLMHGMFRANGGCGYVKKPDFLMNAGQETSNFMAKGNLQVKKTLKIKVYMGYGWHLDFKKTHFNLWSSPDFYTRVGIAGVPADKKMARTKKMENSWTPVWEEEFMFRLTVPELALLRVEVHDYNVPEKDDFAGQTCLPVTEIRPGFRAVPLYDRKGEKFSSIKLFMWFEFV